MIRLALNGMQTDTNFPGDTQFAFNLAHATGAHAAADVVDGAIGLLGGLLPAVRAGSLPIVATLRETRSAPAAVRSAGQALRDGSRR